MGYSGLETCQNERIFTAEVFIQHHGAVQPLIALARSSFGPSADMDDKTNFPNN